MLVRSLMTDCAFQLDMVGDRFCLGDLGVACSTFLRCFQRLRIMRIVALDARLQRVVAHRIDLGKASRPGRVVGVADRTELPFSRSQRLD